MIITQSAAKQIKRLQTMKCFYFIHPLMQEWKSAEIGGMREVIVSGNKNWQAGDMLSLKITDFSDRGIPAPSPHMHR